MGRCSTPNHSRICREANHPSFYIAVHTPSCLRYRRRQLGGRGANTLLLFIIISEGGASREDLIGGRIIRVRTDDYGHLVGCLKCVTVEVPDGLVSESVILLGGSRFPEVLVEIPSIRGMHQKGHEALQVCFNQERGG